MKIVLFDQASANLDSPTFEANGQVTIIGMGLQDGDYITFEVVNVVPGANVPCGCRISTLNPAQIAGTQELICPVCETDTVRPVRLTERNPIVVIDHPQNTLLRAIYHGTGVDMRTVSVWAENTATTDLTDALRGCPPVCCEDEPQTWEETGERRCVDSTQTVQVQEVSNCGNLRWVADPDQPAEYWNDTGVIRCTSGEAVENQQVNPCGQLNWVDTAEPVFWMPTGGTACVDGTLYSEEQNNCGRNRWIDNGPCEIPCVPNWTNTGAIRCTGANIENEQTDGCGNSRWVDSGTQVVWTNNGAQVCGPGGTFLQPQVNQCGNTRNFNTGVACGGCVPDWQPTGATRCIGVNIENQEADGCGNSRWVDSGNPVVWTDNGAQVCSGVGGTFLQPQVNQCGNTRNFNTGVPCDTPCVPNWTNTGVTRCTGVNVENEQEDGCGNERWANSGTPVVWTNTGTTRCQANVVENQQSNQCGTLRWNPTATPCEIPVLIDISSPPGEVDPGDQICWTVTSDRPALAGGLPFTVTVSGSAAPGGNVCGSYNGTTSGPVITTIPGTIPAGSTTATVCYTVPGA